MGKNEFVKEYSVKVIKRMGLLVLLVGLTVLLFSSTGCVLLPREDMITAPQLKVPSKVAFDIFVIKKATFLGELICTGNFVSEKRKDLSFINISDRLKKKYAEIGDKVKKGDLLAQLVTNNLESQIQQQEINIKKLQLENELLKSNVKKEVEFARIQLNNTKEQLENAINKPDNLSQQEINALKEQVLKQEIILENSKLSLKNNIKISELTIKQNDLLLTSLKKQFTASNLVSPFDGTVTYVKPINEGEIVEAYKTIISVADLSSLMVEYSGDQVDKFALGMKVKIINEDNDYTGEVVATPSDMPADADKKMKKSTWIRVNEPLKNLKDIEINKNEELSELEIGKSVQIVLLLLRKENAIFIPKNLIHNDGKRNYVRVFENDIKKERDIVLGDDNVTDVLVLSGLDVGDKVVID